LGGRSVRSVANLTREDGEAFFALIDRHPVTTHVQTFALSQANEAMAALRGGAIAWGFLSRLDVGLSIINISDAPAPCGYGNPGYCL